jgi:isochorismate synthase
MTDSDNNYIQLRKLQKVLFQQNIPFVSYRLPSGSDIITLVQHHSLPDELDSLASIDSKTGFVIAPFEVSEAHKRFFLQPDCVFFGDDIADLYIKKLAENNRFIDLLKAENTISTTTADEFTGNVNKAVGAIKANDFHKVVLSKVCVKNLQDDFKPEDFFLRLCAKYPHAMVYVLQLSGVGCWMGATPEPLLTVEDEIIKTVSLAGTQVATEKEISAYHWVQKEVEEQEIVTGFVEKTLQLLGINDYTKTGPMNYQAANLVHLKTAFEFRQNEFSRLGDFLLALHPTPSVGGLPKAEAKNFILANEQHERSYYTGFLGPININDKTDIFVNLRCLQLFEHQFVLYSGAGITASSVAENEWTETDNKMMTMMNVMKTRDS